MIAGRALTRTSTGLRWAAGKCLDGAAWCAAFAWRRLPPVAVVAVAVPLAWAAPPPVGSEDWEILHPHADWIRGVMLDGAICCTIADGRPVDARTRGDRWQVKWRPGQLAGAPTEWTDVPAEVVVRVANPTGFPIAFWLQGKLRCFVPPGGV